MRTSQEIYHRVRWDARFDASRFVLGVEQRGRAPKRVPLPSFEPDGEIPWHRVLFVEADGEVVWDRATKLDALDASRAGLARRERLLPAPFFEARTPHVFAEGRWRPVSAAGAGAGSAGAADPALAGSAGQIRILTWNTLWDRYDSELIHTGRRRPMLLAALAAADADVIALQEVEPALVKMLLAEPWVRREWTLGADPRSADVPDSGLLLLSRLPVSEAGWHPLGRFKAVTAVVVETATGPVVVADTHLSSDHSTDGAALRDEQLAQVADGLSGLSTPVVVVGDFNDDTDAPATRLGLTDAWTHVHGGGDRTPTFDPAANPLAAVSSLSGEAKRLDRVLVRGWQAVEARLVGAAPDDEGLFVSDHYGVSAVLEPEVSATDGSSAAASPLYGALSLDARPTARTAVAWIPPEELWSDVQEIRRRLDPQVLRWPPHVNVLFGFVRESEFAAAVPLIRQATADLPEFEVRLGEVRRFRHRDDSTLWLDPEGEGWQALHAALLERFPSCRSRDEYTPHLTIGKVPDPEHVAVEVAPITAVVDRLAVLSRRGDEPMRVRAVVTFRPTGVRYTDVDEPAESALDEPSREPEATLLTERIRAALPEAAVYVVGSRRTGTALPGADLDLVAAVPGAPDIAELEQRVAVAVGARSGTRSGMLCRVRQMVGARVPGLRIVTPGLDADLVLAPVGAVPVTEAVGRRAELGETIAASLSAVSDAEALSALRPGAHVRVVKAWAHARGLDAAPLGGLPGLAWAVMAARCRDLTDFFETWAAHDWQQPIPTPTPPVRDLAQHVTAAVRDLITEELYDAWETVTASRDALPALLAPPPLHRRHRRWAVVTLLADDIEQRDVLEGRVRGRMRSLLTALEDAQVTEVHAWPWPFHATDTELRFAIGLGRFPPTREGLEAITKHWLRGLTGVGVRLVDNGEVPTLR